MKNFKKAAVLGSGVMGSAIAAHLANAGLDVLLLDIVPSSLTDDEIKAGLTLKDKIVRNRIAKQGLDSALKAKYPAFYTPEFVKYIEIGNFEDDIKKIKDCDWVIEVIIERMDIKKNFYKEKVVNNVGNNTIISSNTSGLSINEMASVFPEELKERFLITHFFNPPRYMRLVELVPNEKTSKEVMKLMADFLSNKLGKGVVYAKDTPNFIANRIGVYGMCNAIKHMVELDMTVEEVDAVGGSATGKPKSAVFKTTDLVGIDTFVHVANNSYEYLVNDDEREIFKIPQFVKDMVEKGLLGNKTKKGFYKKVNDEEFYYDYKVGDYVPRKRPKFQSVEAAKMALEPKDKLLAVLSGKDKAAEFAWRNIRDTLLYTFKRIPEIADDIVNVDNAMKWGFNWDFGPFEGFDLIGVKNFVERCEKDGIHVPEKLKKIDKFYDIKGGKKYYYDFKTDTFVETPVKPGEISLTLLKNAGKIVEENKGASLIDLGDGVFCAEFHSVMNTIGPDTLTIIRKGIKRAEEEGRGLVIANQGKNFSAGANLMLMLSTITEGAFEDIDLGVREFQNTSMLLKYSKVPVVVAPFNITVGGACEFTLHSDAAVAYAETYIGLVEVGVGLLPGGGGTKEMAVRAIKDAEYYGVDILPVLGKYFENIAMAKYSSSAYEAKKMGYLTEKDTIVMDIDNLIYEAKCKVVELSRNYRPKREEDNLKAPGRDIYASIKSQIYNLKMGNFISEYDSFIANTIAYVMCGGDVAGGTIITERYLLDLEREGFLKLCREKKTLERIKHMLQRGKPLRN
jgi:3-hydroxyacyl-CoA dehydrogenase